MVDIKINITPETKVAELLDNYPKLEKVLIELAPAFSKLKNPLLRKTIAKITSLRQAAVVGGVSIGKLINTLRDAAGLEFSEVKEEFQTAINNLEVNDGFETILYDAREDLANGAHPLGKVMSALHHLESNQKYLLVTPFIPAPLIDKAKEKGFSADIIKKSDEQVETYFKRK